MRSDSFDFYTFSSKFPARRPRIRVIEWLIAAVFLITLLISSGVFLKVSNAADNRAQGKERHDSNVQIIVPGTLGIIATKNKNPHLSLRSLSEDMDDNSCELKS